LSDYAKVMTTKRPPEPEKPVLVAMSSKLAGLPFVKFRLERVWEDAASLRSGLPARFEPPNPRFKVAISQANPLGKSHG